MAQVRSITKFYILFFVLNQPVFAQDPAAAETFSKCYGVLQGAIDAGEMPNTSAEAKRNIVDTLQKAAFISDKELKLNEFYKFRNEGERLYSQDMKRFGASPGTILPCISVYRDASNLLDARRP